MADAPHQLRVLSVAHTAVSRVAGRLRYEPLIDDPTLALRLIVPRRWHEFGRWLDAEPETGKLDVIALPIWLPRAGPAKWYLHAYSGLATAARAFQPEVLHLWEEPWSIVALQVTHLARRTGAALVLEVDQNILRRLPAPFETIRRYVLEHTALILSRSRDATDVVRACGYCGPATPIGYGVDETYFFPGDPCGPAPPLRLGYAGRLVAEKGLDDVLTALRQTMFPVTFAMLGAGPYETALRARVQAEGLADRVSFEPWADPARVAEFMRAQHAIILPTRTTDSVKEQFGRVIIEAQACGIPVIGSSSGAIPSVMGDGGWTFPERDPAALADLIERIAASPEERIARGSAGIANVAERFTYAAVASALLRGWQYAATSRATRTVRRSRSRAIVRTAAE